MLVLFLSSCEESVLEKPSILEIEKSQVESNGNNQDQEVLVTSINYINQRSSIDQKNGIERDDSGYSTNYVGTDEICYDVETCTCVGDGNGNCVGSVTCSTTEECYPDGSGSGGPGPIGGGGYTPTVASIPSSGASLGGGGMGPNPTNTPYPNTLDWVDAHQATNKICGTYIFDRIGAAWVTQVQNLGALAHYNTANLKIISIVELGTTCISIPSSASSGYANSTFKNSWNAATDKALADMEKVGAGGNSLYYTNRIKFHFKKELQGRVAGSTIIFHTGCSGLISTNTAQYCN